jgi:DHA3 family macrolide efflux protein-like MFS transporter
VTALVGLIGAGFGMIAFGLVPKDAFWLALVVIFARAAMVPMIRGSVLAIFQSYVPPEMQGRVFTLLISSISVMAPIGLAIGGPVAEAFGAIVLFVAGGIGCLGIALVWSVNSRIMHLEERAEPAVLDIPS